MNYMVGFRMSDLMFITANPGRYFQNVSRLGQNSWSAAPASWKKSAFFNLNRCHSGHATDVFPHSANVALNLLVSWTPFSSV
jgi:hypothetical protein